MPEPLGYPATRERQKMGFLLETTWGTIPAGTPRLLPVETPDLGVTPQRVLDSGPRGRWAQDHRSYRTVQEGVATLSGPFYPYLTVPFLGMFFADESTVTQFPINGVAGNDIVMHRFQIAAQPGTGTSLVQGLSLFHEDEITGFGGTQNRVSGFLVPNFNLSFNKAEGLLTWSSDLRGRSSTAAFSGSGTAIGVYTLAGASAIAVDGGAGVAVATPSTNILHGFNASVVIHRNNPASGDPNASGATTTVTSASAGEMEVQSIDIRMERPLTWSYAGGNVRTPSDFALGAPRITFVVTLEFQSYQQYRRWLSFDDNSLTTAGFGAGLATAHEQWQILLVNFAGITLPTVTTNGLGDVNLEAATGSALNNSTFLGQADRHALYLEFPEVEYAENEPTIARGDDLVTIQLAALALPDPRAAGGSTDEVSVVKVYDAQTTRHLLPS